MSIGFFVDEKHKPTSKEILEAIGSKQPLWEELIQFIKDNYRVKEEFVFSGKITDGLSDSVKEEKHC